MGRVKKTKSCHYNSTIKILILSLKNILLNSLSCLRKILKNSKNTHTFTNDTFDSGGLQKHHVIVKNQIILITTKRKKILRMLTLEEFYNFLLYTILVVVVLQLWVSVFCVYLNT